MTERTYTAEEAKSLAVEAARIAIALSKSDAPLPSTVTVAEAAKILKVSPRTLSRLNLPRNGAGKIPYTAVLAMQAQR